MTNRSQATLQRLPTNIYRELSEFWLEFQSTHAIHKQDPPKREAVELGSDESDPDHLTDGVDDVIKHRRAACGLEDANEPHIDRPNQRSTEGGRMNRRLIAVAVCLMAFVAVNLWAQCPELVGRWPHGPTYAVAADGNHIYFGSGSALQIAAVAAPEAPVIVASLTLPDVVTGIALDGGHAYIADSAAGLRIVNVSTPSSPVEVAFVSIPGWATDVAVADGHAYVLTWGALHIVDVSTPSLPVEVGSFGGISGGAVAAGGGYAYTVESGGTMKIIDATTPSSPSLVFYLETVINLGDIAVSGDYAYLAGWMDFQGRLTVFNVSTPSSPVEVATVEAVVNSGICSITISGQYGYVSGGDLLEVIDLTLPSSPVPVSQVTVGYQTPIPVSVAVTNSHAYVATEQGIRVVDVTAPEWPTAAGLINTGALKCIAAQGPYAYVVEAGGLRVVDVSNPASPVAVGFAETPTLQVTGCEVSGSYVYLPSMVCETGSWPPHCYGRIRVFGVSVPSSPIDAGTIDIEEAYQPPVIAASGNMLYVSFGPVFQILDVSSPLAPSEVGSCVITNWGRVTNIDIMGQFAYITTSYDGIRVVDIGTPSSPVEVGSFDPPGGGGVLGTADGSLAFLGSSCLLSVIDTSAPSSPIEVGTYSWQCGDLLGLEGSGAYVYAFSSYGNANGLRVVDVSDPLVPVEVGYHPGRPWMFPAYGYGGMAISDGRVYSADSSSGFEIFRECSANGWTPTGGSITVEPVDPATGTSPVDITFGEVIEGGDTTVATTDIGPDPGALFEVGNSEYIEITTTATIVPPIRLCFDYSAYGFSSEDESSLRVLHLVHLDGQMGDGSTCLEPVGCWDDITDPDLPPDSPNPDTENDVVCGTSNSLSLFAVARALRISAPVDPIPVNTEVYATLDLGDPDVVDAAIWTWGDGAQTAATLSFGLIEGAHSYVSAGIYTPHLSLWKEGLEVASTEFKYLVIYDPDGGYVTGGGWITSQPGAYVTDPTLAGKATFGFVAKYRHGTSVPTGTTEFQFHAAGLDFHSTSYQWLVVAGAKAKFKGEGVVNGEPGFGFMISAIDGALPGGGGQDKFRMKIWDSATEELIYDNQLEAPEDADPTTILGGGSIVIHRN